MFVHPVISLLSSRIGPRINEDIRKVLQLSNQVQTRDWYLYQNYTKLRIFECELAPYKLPKFLPMRIFSLEYIRKMLNMDEIHFVACYTSFSQCPFTPCSTINEDLYSEPYMLSHHEDTLVMSLFMRRTIPFCIISQESSFYPSLQDSR